MKIPAVIFTTLLIGSIVCAWIGANNPAHKVEYKGPRATEDIVLFYGYEIDFHDLVDDKYFTLRPSNKIMELTFYSDGNCTKTIQKVK
jgi:hypothetical protein